MKNMRHVVNVMRPPEAQGTRGQSQGSDKEIYHEWPCAIETLSGNKAVQARTVFAEAQHRIEGYGNPASRLKEQDYLTGGTIGSRKLFIGFIKDEQQNGVKLELLCGERTGG